MIHEVFSRYSFVINAQHSTNGRNTCKPYYGRELYRIDSLEQFGCVLILAGVMYLYYELGPNVKMTRKFYLTHLFLGAIFHAAFLYPILERLSGLNFYLVLSAAISNTLFYPFPRLLIRKSALKYSNGAEWEYQAPQSSILVDTLASVVSLILALPVGIPYSISIFYRYIKGAQ